jgi:tetratricopeptide (TPR) repeat protein
MSTDPRLTDLLEQWEELREQGRPASVEELCRGCPELAAELRRRVEALEAMPAAPRPASAAGSATQAGDTAGPADAPPSRAPAVPGFALLRELGRGGMGVHALGTILYELLTGHPPFRGATTLQTLQQVQTLEPVPARRLQPQVPRDLDTVCLKCLQKDPARRYASAAALADDLRRFLRGEPVKARPAPWWERALKWGRRRPAAAAPLAVSAAALLALVLLAVGYSARLRAARDRAEQSEARAAREKGEAEANYQLARQLVDDLPAKLSDEDSASLEELRQYFLHASLAYYERFAKARGDEPTLRAARGLACLRLARITSELGAKGSRAVPLYHQARDVFEGLLRDFPGDAGYRHDLAQVCYHLGRAHADLGQLEKAEEPLNEARVIQERLLEGAAKGAAYRRALAATWFALGQACFARGCGRHRVEAAYRKALGLLDEVGRDGGLTAADHDRRRPPGPGQLLPRPQGVRQGAGVLPEGPGHRGETGARPPRRRQLPQRPGQHLLRPGHHRLPRGPPPDRLGLLAKVPHDPRAPGRGAPHCYPVRSGPGPDLPGAGRPGPPGRPADRVVLPGDPGPGGGAGKRADAQRGPAPGGPGLRRPCPGADRPGALRRGAGGLEAGGAGRAEARMASVGYAQTLACVGRTREALEEIARLDNTRLQPPAAIDLARVYSLCARAARQDVALGVVPRELLGEVYARRALELLEEAGAAGQRVLTNDPMFGPLRGRKDFQKLLAVQK